MFIWILMGGVFILSFIVQNSLKSKFAKYSKVPLGVPMAGRDIAMAMLQQNGCGDVQVTSVSGQLTDHFNPANRTVNLSEPVYGTNSIAAAAVAAHECGHAVQHKVGYSMLQLRTKMVPLVSFASNTIQWLLLAGIVVAQWTPIPLYIAIALFACTVLFSFVTLPVEVDASRRAIQWLQGSGIVSGQQLEYAKDAPDKPRAFAILRDVYWKALRLLHPYMPFVTEEVAHQLGYLKDGETILKAEFPKGLSDEEKAKLGLTEEIYDFVNAKREAITALRALRAEYKVNPAAFVKVTIDARDAATADRLRAEEANLKAFMRAEAVEIVSDGADRAMPGTLTKLGTVYLSLEGLIDKAAEAKRVAAELEKTRGFIKSIDAKLSNENFVAHAPAAIVEGQKTKRAELVENVARLEKLAKLFA